MSRAAANARSTDRALTDRQRSFCHELVKGPTATEAARRAGYSAAYANREASRLAKDPRIRAYVRDLRAELEEEAIMAAREVLQRLTRIARGEGKVLRSTPTGVVELPPDWSDQLRALSLLGKHHGLFVERHDVALSKHPRDMTDEQLLEALSAAGML